MGKKLHQASRIPILVQSFKKKSDNNRKFSYLSKRRSISKNLLKNAEVGKQDKIRRSVLAELSTNPIVSAPTSTNFCDIKCDVPITPRKTRSGKVFARMSQFFGNLNVKPLSNDFSSKDVPLPTLPVVLFEDLVTTEEIDRTIDEVPNLDEISEPTPLFDFAEEMRKSLSPEFSNSDMTIGKEIADLRTNAKDDELQEMMPAICFADASILEPLPVFAKFPGFKSNFEFSMIDELDVTPLTCVPMVKEKESAVEPTTERNVDEVEVVQENESGLKSEDVENSSKITSDEEESKPSSVVAEIPKPAVIDPEVITKVVVSDSSDIPVKIQPRPFTIEEIDKRDAEAAECSLRLSEKQLVPEESAKIESLPENSVSTEFVNNSNPSMRKSRRSTVYRKPVSKEKNEQIANEAVVTEGDDDCVKNKRTQRRNSIFPRQAIKRISTMVEEAEFSTSSEDILNHSSTEQPAETEEQKNDNNEASVSSEAVDDQPKSKRCRKVSSKLQKKKEKAAEKASLKKQHEKPIPTKKDEDEEHEVDDEPIAAVPLKFVSEGRVLVSMVLPKGKNGKRRKVPGIPQTIEIHPTLLKEPGASCIKKKEEDREWSYKKYFRWADSKNESALEHVKEFYNEYNLRQSTFKKSFFKVPDEE